MTKKEIEQVFTPEFLDKRLCDSDVRLILDTLECGGSPYRIIETLVKTKQELSWLIKKII